MDARGRAQSLANETREKAAAAAEARRKEVDAGLQGRIADAEKAFKAALTSQPQQQAAMFNLGRLYRAAGKKGDAQSAFKAYLAKYPAGPWATAAKKELSVP